MNKRFAWIWCICLCGLVHFAQAQTEMSDSFKNVLLDQSELNENKEEPEYSATEEAEATQEVTAEAISETDSEETDDSEPELMELRRISDEDWKKVLADSNFKYTPVKEKVTKTIKPSLWLDGLSWFLNSGIFKFILYLLIACIVLFVVYSIISNSDLRFGSLFSSREKKGPDYTMENVAEFTDWDLALNEALKQGDFRKALRILYLKLLHQMNEKSHIKLEQEKTNWDYANECIGRDYHSDFTLMTKYFDYVWYGEFAINENSFSKLQEIATRLTQKIKES